MNLQVRAMLEKTFDCFSYAFSNPKTAWDRFLEFVLADHAYGMARQFNPDLEWLFTNEHLRSNLHRAYQRLVFTQDTYDHLGDLYVERLVRTGIVEGQVELPKERTVEGMATMLATQCEYGQQVLDPAAGTGRLLLALRKAAPSCIPFGVEKNLDLVRIALTNFAIHAVPGFILHADSGKHEIDLASATGQANWSYANSWVSHWDSLHPRVSANGNRLRYYPSQREETRRGSQ